MGRSRKPLWLSGHRGFKSHTLRHAGLGGLLAREASVALSPGGVEATLAEGLRRSWLGSNAVPYAPPRALPPRSGAPLRVSRENRASLRSVAHAERLAIQDAAAAVGSWRLDGCMLIVTREPCAMCAGALVHARIGSVVFGAAELKAGALGSLYNLSCDPRLNHEFPVEGGVRATECAALLTEFFSARRL